MIPATAPRVHERQVVHLGYGQYVECEWTGSAWRTLRTFWDHSTRPVGRSAARMWRGIAYRQARQHLRDVGKALAVAGPESVTWYEEAVRSRAEGRGSSRRGAPLARRRAHVGAAVSALEIVAGEGAEQPRDGAALPQQRETSCDDPSGVKSTFTRPGLTPGACLTLPANDAAPPSRVCRVCGEISDRLRCATCACRTEAIGIRPGGKRPNGRSS